MVGKTISHYKVVEKQNRRWYGHRL